MRATILGLTALLTALAAAPAQATPLSGCAADPAGEVKIALVIGQSNYADNVVPAGVKDADAFADALCRADGFTYVDKVRDASSADMQAALDALEAKRLALKPRLAVIYYSGHSISLGGNSFLIPIGADTKAPTGEIARQSVAMGALFKALGPKDNNTARIVILDACREPLLRGDQTPAVPRSEITGTGNFLIAYGAPEGKRIGSTVGAGGNSVFTWALLQGLNRKGLNVADLHFAVGVALSQILNAQGGQDSDEDAPVYGSLTGYYYYAGKKAGGGDASSLEYVSDVGNLMQAMQAIPAAAGTNRTYAMNTGAGELDTALKAAREALARTRAAQDPDTGATENLATPDFAGAAHYLEIAAKLGSTSAMRKLGDLYRNGLGVTQNRARACELYKAAADANDMVAIERYGDCLRDTDAKAALAQYHRAYAMGFLEAKSGEAYMYVAHPELAAGENATALALRTFQQAEREGSPEAAGWIGWLLLAQRVRPTSLSRDEEIRMAVEAFERGDRAGDTAATEYLARVYQDGINGYVPGRRDPDKAKALFRRAVQGANAWFVKEYDLLRAD